MGAYLGGQRETRRDRDADVRHLGQARALAAQKVLHFRGAFRRAVAEIKDVFTVHRSSVIWENTSKRYLVILTKKPARFNLSFDPAFPSPPRRYLVLTAAPWYN
jgi:hypothetical protein